MKIILGLWQNVVLMELKYIKWNSKKTNFLTFKLSTMFNLVCYIQIKIIKV